eukprot:gene4369-biopygen4305
MMRKQSSSAIGYAATFGDRDRYFLTGRSPMLRVTVTSPWTRCAPITFSTQPPRRATSCCSDSTSARWSTVSSFASPDLFATTTLESPMFAMCATSPWMIATVAVVPESTCNASATTENRSCTAANAPSNAAAMSSGNPECSNTAGSSWWAQYSAHSDPPWPSSTAQA